MVHERSSAALSSTARNRLPVDARYKMATDEASRLVDRLAHGRRAHNFYINLIQTANAAAHQCPPFVLCTSGERNSFGEGPPVPRKGPHDAAFYGGSKHLIVFPSARRSSICPSPFCARRRLVYALFFVRPSIFGFAGGEERGGGRAFACSLSLFSRCRGSRLKNKILNSPDAGRTFLQYKSTQHRRLAGYK